MTDCDPPGEREIPRGAHRGVAIACVAALFLFAIYPGAVEATIINDDSRQANLNSRGPFLFRQTLPRVSSNAEACSLRSLRADAGSSLKGAERTSGQAGYEAELTNLAYLSSSSLFRDGDSRPGSRPRGESPAWDRIIWEPNDLGPEARLSISIISDLDRIKARIQNVANCLKYMQYLLQTIEEIFNLPQKNTDTAFDRTAGSDQDIFVFSEVGQSVEDSSDPAIVVAKYTIDSSDPAIAVSNSIQEKSLKNSFTAMLNTSQVKLTRNPNVRLDAARPERKTTRKPLNVKVVMKQIVIDIFSQAYTYVLIVVVSVFGLFLRNRA